MNNSILAPKVDIFDEICTFGHPIAGKPVAVPIDPVAFSFYLWNEHSLTCDEIGRELLSIYTNCDMGKPAKSKYSKDFTDEVKQYYDNLSRIVGEYFAEKVTMRTLVGKTSSDWDRKVNRATKNIDSLNNDDIPVIATLPRIYEKNINEDRVFAGAKSYPSTQKKAVIETPPLVLEHKYTTDEMFNIFFFRSEEGYVSYMKSPKKTPSTNILRAVLTGGARITISGKVKVHPFYGRDTKVIEIMDYTEIKEFSQ